MAPRVWLERTEKGADRALIIGGSGTGKSTLAAALMERFQTDHPKARVLIADTKPRWRGNKCLRGTIGERYKNMVKGDIIDGMVIDSLDDWQLAWDQGLNPAQCVIAQPPIVGEGDHDIEVERQVGLIRRFFNTTRPATPSLLYIDEGMDFFGPTGVSKHGDIIQRCYRAGRELGLVTLMAVQRPSCITVLALSESNVKYLFALGSDDDFMNLRRKGFPSDIQPVREDYYFRLLRDRQLYPKMLTLGK